ncbi:hypothetical protein QBC41DRAFT_145982 [Cercophora samala]|uniref:Nephrocystin 3-like N-terminal domain-containing protein n=1 Tax=Cercophora samala TaxID=330535 RepID=A0AA39Z9K4_9PEZI|nr:hypothetical protein QBC41DRAFT_145982 [Cercophora samala]
MPSVSLYSKYAPSREPSNEGLDETLIKVLGQCSRKIFIVIIDELDECLSASERDGFVKFLASLTHSNTKVAITSRGEADINTAMQALPEGQVAKLALDAAVVDQDIRPHNLEYMTGRITPTATGALC